jgi:glycerol-3-phosphate O-acyltransferase
MAFTKWFAHIVERSRQAYGCHLPASPGPVRSFLLRQLFKGVSIDARQSELLEHLPPDALVVYVTKARSRLQWLLAFHRYEAVALPRPKVALRHRTWLWQPVGHLMLMLLHGMRSLLLTRRLSNAFEDGTLAELLRREPAALMALLEKRGFKRWALKGRIDPLQFLIENQNVLRRPIYLVPQLLFFGRNPATVGLGVGDLFFGPQPSPGLLRRLWLLVEEPHKVFVEISEPLALADFCRQEPIRDASPEDQALHLRMELLARINRHYRSVIGPIPKSREELRQQILAAPRMEMLIRRQARRRQQPVKKARKQALKYLDEMAACFNPVVMKLTVAVARWIIRTRFDDLSIEPTGLPALKQASRIGPMVLIPCHKSNLDSMVLGYTLSTVNLPAPHFFAGKNLAFWPVGGLLRRVGAFFVRRSFKGAVFYAMVFSEYIQRLLKDGHNIAVYIEGTRSRTGKLLNPQVGMLQILVNAWREKACEELFFVPVFIGYDRVPEESAYLHEARGGDKEPESLKQLVKTRGFFKARYGTIYIRFGTPQALSELASANGGPGRRMNGRQQAVLCQQLGRQIMQSIDRSLVITPRSLVAGAILTMKRSRFERREVLFRVETYLSFLVSQEAELAESLMLDWHRAVQHVLGDFLRRKYIRQMPHADEAFHIRPGPRPILEYYKNNSLAALAPGAMTALALLDLDQFQFSASQLHPGYETLADLLSNEFPRGVSRSAAVTVRKTLKVFIDDAVLSPHPTLPDTHNLTSEGFRKLKAIAELIKPLLEAYLVALDDLAHFNREEKKHKDVAKRLQSRGQKMLKRKRIGKPEALSVPVMQAAWENLVQKGLRGREDQARILDLAAALQRFLSRLN